MKSSEDAFLAAARSRLGRSTQPAVLLLPASAACSANRMPLVADSLLCTYDSWADRKTHGDAHLHAVFGRPTIVVDVFAFASAAQVLDVSVPL